MNLINKSEEEIKSLSEKLHNLKKYGSNKETLTDILNYLIPQNKIIGIKIDDKLNPAYFDLDQKEVKISIKKLNKMIKTSIVKLKQIFSDINEEEMFNYYILFALTHEIRHVRQYLIAEGYINSYQIMKQVYKDMSNIGKLNTSFIRNYISSIIYFSENTRFLIERNANIEASEILKTLAEYEENNAIADVFSEVRHKNIMYGYDDKYNGSIEETYKRLYLTPFYKNLPVDEAIPVRDRILYGLPINEETKKKVLEKRY